MRSAHSAVGGYIMNTCGIIESFVLFFISYSDPNISFLLFLSSAEQWIDVFIEVSVTTPRTLSWVVKANSEPITVHVKVGLFAFINVEYYLSFFLINCNCIFLQFLFFSAMNSPLSAISCVSIFSSSFDCVGEQWLLCCCLWKGFSWTVGFFSSALLFVTSPPSFPRFFFFIYCFCEDAKRVFISHRCEASRGNTLNQALCSGKSEELQVSQLISPCSLSFFKF